MKKIGIFGLFLVSSASLVACGNGEEENGNEGASNGGDTVQVGVANEEPYGYINIEENEVTGAAPEIARAVLQSIGYEDIEGNVADFGALIQGVSQGQFDIATAAMDIRPERCENGNFGDIEMQYGEGIVVQAGNPLGITSYEDIVANPEIRVAVMRGANQMNYLDSLGINEDQYVQADSIADNMAAVESDNADVMVATDATANVAAQNNSSGNVEFVEEFEQPIIEGESVMAYGAAVFPQSDEGDEMREAYNEGLQELIDSGELLEILEEFGFTEANLPPTDITTEDRCNV
ncbi:polar amino acid transport system substrate-binding protein [Alkalihalobacillus xiaoxiensis]|uniref:Polar amino acid transport system substrate-binding protein n=1 Tax=Shouchella xiaoxiensis TaxID=766895 RepID=A0ABS2T161_9BACI|nr:ectoine/hydroxyectoine ABC transporter substrate-binding protein EhuB [Shouchella xiaoxiensis]MBM7841235.1 polar amino acid transport system substrate-binding protein [Shouchella xiaoxiensis]